jgi:hypothetical protein
MAWNACSDALLSGELFDVVAHSGRVASGASARGVFAWVAATGFALGALFVARGKLLGSAQRAP